MNCAICTGVGRSMCAACARAWSRAQMKDDGTVFAAMYWAASRSRKKLKSSPKALPTKAQLWRRVARIVGELALIDGPDEPPFGLIPSGMKSVYDVKGFVGIVRAIDRGAVACAMKRKRERLIAKLEAALAAWEAAK